MSGQASASCAQVLFNFPQTTGGHSLRLSPPHLRHGKFGVHVLPTNRLPVQRESTCWNRRAESALAWKGGRLLAVACTGDGHIMMPGGLSIVRKPTAALRPRPMSNNFLGRKDQRHRQRLVESACTVSYGTHPPSTPQDFEDEGPNPTEIYDESRDNIISESKTTGRESGVITPAGLTPISGFPGLGDSIDLGKPRGFLGPETGTPPSRAPSNFIGPQDGTPPPSPPPPPPPRAKTGLAPNNEGQIAFMSL